MSGSKARSRAAAKQQTPRIRPAEASAIFKRCEQVLDESRELLLNLRSAGISELFGRMDDRMLHLAIQPDPWGERTRARLMSDIAPVPRKPWGRTVSIEDIVQVTKCCYAVFAARNRPSGAVLPSRVSAESGRFRCLH